VKKRLFIAVDISDEARESAAAHIQNLKMANPDSRVSWTKPDNLHLTLKFLDDVREERVPGLISALDNIRKGFTEFELVVAGTGVFPSPRKPKVLWLGVNDRSGTLKSLAKEIDAALIKLDFPKEERDFSPHLTIGRIRDSRSGRNIARAHIQHDFAAIRFTLDGFVLYESKLSPSGSVYTPVSRFRLSE
jgi:RNA 2',3'-cyclic 3'-phosphodiesterase